MVAAEEKTRGNPIWWPKVPRSGKKVPSTLIPALVSRWLHWLHFYVYVMLIHVNFVQVLCVSTAKKPFHVLHSACCRGSDLSSEREQLLGLFLVALRWMSCSVTRELVFLLSVRRWGGRDIRAVPMIVVDGFYCISIGQIEWVGIAVSKSPCTNMKTWSGPTKRETPDQGGEHLLFRKLQ